MYHVTLCNIYMKGDVSRKCSCKLIESYNIDFCTCATKGVCVAYHNNPEHTCWSCDKPGKFFWMQSHGLFKIQSK